MNRRKINGLLVCGVVVIFLALMSARRLTPAIFSYPNFRASVVEKQTKSAVVPVSLPAGNAVSNRQITGVTKAVMPSSPGIDFNAITTVATPDPGDVIPVAAEQIKAGKIVARVRFNQDQISLSKKDGYDVVELADGRPANDAPGSPMLPVRLVNLMIPAGTTVTGIRFDVTGEPWKSDVSLYPSQPPVHIGDDPAAQAFVAPDPVAYAQPGPYPENVAEVTGVHTMRGNRYVSVRLNPVRYLPASKKLRVIKSIRILLEVVPEAVGSGADLKRNPIFDAALKSMVVNPDLLEVQVQLSK